jgi:hypothetical protein
MILCWHLGLLLIGGWDFNLFAGLTMPVLVGCCGRLLLLINRKPFPAILLLEFVKVGGPKIFNSGFLQCLQLPLVLPYIVHQPLKFLKRKSHDFHRQEVSELPILSVFVVSSLRFAFFILGIR